MGLLHSEKKSYMTFSVNGKYFPTYDKFYRFMKTKPKVEDFYVNDKLVHGGTRLPEPFAYLLSSEPFKRIFHIYQLSEKHLLVKRATHRRGEHCIGVGITIGKILNNSKNEGSVRSLDDEKILNYMAAAMIHDDLGHLSQGHVHAKRLKEMGIKFEEKETSIAKLKKMEHLLKEKGFDVKQIMSIIKGEDKLSFLIDDPLDGDKQDYFVRDGIICSVNFNPTPLAVCNSVLNNLLVDSKGWYVKGPVPMEPIIRDFHALRIALYEGCYWNDLNGRNADVMIRHVCEKYVEECAEPLKQNKSKKEVDEEIILHLSQLDDTGLYGKMQEALPDDRTLKKLLYAHDPNLSSEKVRELMWKPVLSKVGEEARNIITDYALKRSFEVTDEDGNIIAVDLRKPKPLKKKPARVVIKPNKLITRKESERLYTQPSTGITVFSENPYLQKEEALNKAIDLFYREH